MVIIMFFPKFRENHINKPEKSDKIKADLAKGDLSFANSDKIKA